MKKSQVLSNWYIRELKELDMPQGAPSPQLWDEQPDAAGNWIPGGSCLSVQEALLEAGLLDKKILDGKTEPAAWVAEKDWVYCCDFDSAESSSVEYLNFKGVDTVADIYLNGELLGHCDDMFIPHRFQVTGRLRDRNRLLVAFRSPLKALDEAKASFPDDWRHLIEPYSVLRKSPLDLMDFGRVTYIKVGLFEDVCLETVDKAEIKYLDTKIKFGEWYKWATLTVSVEASCACEGFRLAAELTDPDGSVCAVDESAFENGNGSVSLKVNAPKLWYPRNYGDQPLYKLAVTLTDDNGNVLDSARRTVGFRNLEKTGDMRWRVNGKEIKLWGANFAPFYGPTHNWSRQKERCRIQMHMAARANMNCIRLWGGGEQYGDDLYEWADELGILIWQEFFLWWGYYPETSHWRELYRQEADFHVRRLKHHPCILLWSAGNEILCCNEESHWPEDKKELSYVIFREDYADVCKRLDPERVYLPTAPSGGDYPNDPREGDTHPLFYSIRHPVNEYPLFPSEIAHSSIGPLRSLRRFMTDEEIWPEGYINQLTQNAYNHYAREYENLTQPTFSCIWKRIPIPSTWWNHANNYFASECGPLEHFFDAENPEQLVYRINAAFADYTKNETEKLRRGKHYHAVDAPRRTQGVLLWKINDTWPQFYCTLVDYFLETQQPYYQVRRSYSPVLLSYDFQDATYLWGTNDTAETVEGSVYICSFSPARNCVDREFSVPVRLRPGDSRVITDLSELCPILRENIIYACLRDKDGNIITRADTALDIERNLSFQNAELSLTVENGELCITTDRCAYSVELSGNENGDEFGWHFEDNYFNLLPFEKKRVKVFTDHKAGTIFAKAHYSTKISEIATDGIVFEKL